MRPLPTTSARARDFAGVALGLGLCAALAAGAVRYLLPGIDATAAIALCAAALAVSAVLFARQHHLRRQNRRMRVALDNMSQGLCMFDRDEKLVVCNQRYKEMYGMPEHAAAPGTSLTGLLEFRASLGTFSSDIAAYRRELLASLAEKKTTSREIPSKDGGTILVTNRPMQGGGWVATHEDVTERRAAERERLGMQQQQAQRAAIEQAIGAFRRRVEELLRTVTEGAMTMRTTAGALLTSSGRTAQCADGAVGASNDASSNVDTAAVAADELSGSIAEIERQLGMTADIVRAAVGEAKDTNAQIAALAEAAQKIGDVIKLIRAIAGQTNLLALNATIEAARAGEAGKGFAVVAAEVKSLAVQTAKATEDISALIKSVQGATGGAVNAIGRIAARMQEIDSCATAVAASVGQQSAATAQISQNVAGAADGAKLVVSVLQEVATAAGATRRSAEEVLAASEAVDAAAAALRGEVEGFLARVAA
jgi:methyl-accepting chemotaxis protein